MKQDPLALAFIGAAIALLAGMLFYVFVIRTPEPVPPGGAPGTLESLRSRVEGAVDKLRDKPAAKPQAAPQPQAPGSAVPGSTIEAGHSWRYAVVVEPPAAACPATACSTGRAVAAAERLDRSST